MRNMSYGVFDIPVKYHVISMIQCVDVASRHTEVVMDHVRQEGIDAPMIFFAEWKYPGFFRNDTTKLECFETRRDRRLVR